MKQLETETDEQMLAIYEDLLRAHAVSRCRRAFMHDIRNPAQSIQSGLELLERVLTAKTTKVSADRCIELIRQSLGNLQRVVENTLDTIAPCSAQPTDFRPHTLLEELTQLLVNDAASRGLSFRIDVDPSLAMRATLPRVRQVLLSLLLDALDATDGPGTVTGVAATGADGCVLQLIDTRANGTLTAETRGISLMKSQPALSKEQWWQALAALVRAERGSLDREQTAERHIVRLKLPCAAAELSGT